MVAASAKVAIVAANPRRPPTICSNRVNSGHVEKHKIAAHKAAEINGRKISRQPKCQ
jgi:hypothetical protein